MVGGKLPPPFAAHVTDFGSRKSILAMFCKVARLCNMCIRMKDSVPRNAFYVFVFSGCGLWCACGASRRKGALAIPCVWKMLRFLVTISFFFLRYPFFFFFHLGEYSLHFVIEGMVERHSGRGNLDSPSDPS